MASVAVVQQPALVTITLDEAEAVELVSTLAAASTSYGTYRDLSQALDNAGIDIG